MAITIKQVAIDLLSKLGIELTDPTTATALQQQDVIFAINGALQALQTAGQDFFTRELLDISLGAGTAFYTIPHGVQAVLGPLRWNGVPLRAMASRGELDQFDRIFLGGTGFGTSSGNPLAYWVQNLRAGDSGDGDIDQVNIYMAPVQDVPGILEAEVVYDAPHYTAANIGDSTPLPVAQAYTESVLLPIARYLILLSSQFSRPDLRPQITSEYQLAMQTLGFKGGFPNAEQPGPTRSVDA